MADVAKLRELLERVVVPVDKPETSRAYFERTHRDRPDLKVLGKPCHDCAITCDFYTPYAEELAKEDRDFQTMIAARWFCHNHPNRACRGVSDYLDARALLSQAEGEGA